MKTVLILCGGKSEEHEISLISAKCILDAIDRKAWKPVVVGISRSGKWFLEEEKTFYKGEVRADKIKLNEDAPTVSVAPFPTPAGRGVLVSEGKTLEFDVCFPILHGPYGEDGRLQGMLDMMHVPYVGSNCGSSWICMDKALSKTMCEREGIEVAKFIVVNSLSDFEAKRSRISALGDTVFVKPSRMGSSVGISKIVGGKGLDAAVEGALKHDTKVLIEAGIRGREIECAVLGLNGQVKVAAPGEIIPSKKIGWYSYEAKYLLTDGAETVVPAALDMATTIRVQKFAEKAFNLLECDGMARVDLFLEEGTGKLFLNEINTIPGFTPISMYPKMWQASGVSYPQLLSRLLELAFERSVMSRSGMPSH